MKIKTSISRRRLLTSAGSTTLAAGAVALPLVSRRARAQSKTLRIMQWRHFVPAFDPWFNEAFAKQWGETNDTHVVIDNVSYGEITTRAAAEIQAQRGHDLIQFVTPHAMFYDHVVDHREVFEECTHRYGKPADFAVRANYNPRTNKYLGFAAAFQPALVVFRRDLWGNVQTLPNTWADVWSGSRRIKLLYEKSVGLSLASEHNCEQTLRSTMYSFGSSEQDIDGNPSLKSSATLEALKYVKDLYEQCMIKDVLTWDGASNNRFMLTGEGSLTVDSLSIVRASETMKLAFEGSLGLAPMPQGPAARLGTFGFYNYSIWKFADNVEGAKRFLVDYVGRSKEAFLASGFQNMPCYPDTIPDLATLTSSQVNDVPGKYSVMKDVPSWTTNAGHPGCTNPAVSEVYEKGLISRMFAAVATGRLSPEAALDEASQEEQKIFRRWKEAGKI
jgi:multiple sugar transport system substrate-binding protein